MHNSAEKCTCCVRLNWDESIARLNETNQALADALSLMKKGATGAKPPVFLAKYGYGEVIVGIDGSRVRSQLLHVPCSVHELSASDPQDLMAQCGSDMPLGIVLSGVAEVYLQYPLSSEFPVSSPLRILRPGDIFGVFEALDALASTAPNVSRSANWHVASGLRSVHAAAPLGNMAIAKRFVADHKRNSIVSRAKLNPETIKAEFEGDNWLFLKRIAKLLNAESNAAPAWMCEILLIPQSWLISGLTAGSTKATSELRSALYATGWNQSQSLRYYHSDLPQIAEKLAKHKSHIRAHEECFKHSYLHRMLLHLSSICQGDVPGFTPVTHENQGGPFMEILSFLQTNEYNLIPGMKDHFPLLLQPYQIQSQEASPPPLYYSLERPSALGPIQEPGRDHTVIMATLQECLKVLKGSPQFERLKSWRLLTTEDNWVNEEYRVESLLPGDFFHPKLEPDFREQLALAKVWNTGSSQLIQHLRSTFISRFIRMTFKSQQAS